MGKCYKFFSGKHDYCGRSEGRGHRQRSKVLRSCKNMASLGLLDEVAREDARRREERERDFLKAAAV